MAKNIKVNALASILVRVFNILFPLITGPYLARILSKEAYGEFNAANSILNLFIPFAAFGIYSYGIRSISRVKNNIKEISKNFTVLFSINVISSLSIGILYIGYMLLNVNSNMYMLYLALSIQIFTQFVTIEWMNEAFENYGFILFKTLFIRVLMLVSIFAFVKKADDIVNYAFILSITNLINYLISFYYIKKKVKFVKVKIKDILIHIKPLIGMLLLANSYMLYTALDRAVLSLLDAKISVSYYTFALSIAQLITSVVYSIIVVSIPRLSYYYGNGDEKNYTELLNQVAKTFLFLVIPMGIGLSCVSDEVMLIYAGEKYLEAGFILKLFSLRIVMWALDQLLANQVLFVRGYEKNITAFYFIGGFINLILNIVLFKLRVIQAEYFVYTTLFSELVVLIIQVYFITKRNIVSINGILKSYIKYVLCSIPFFAITYGINHILKYSLTLNLQFFIRVLAIIISCVLYYFIIMLITKDKILFVTIDGIKSKLRSMKYKLKAKKYNG